MCISDTLAEGMKGQGMQIPKFKRGWPSESPHSTKPKLQLICSSCRLRCSRTSSFFETEGQGQGKSE